jgi:branched-chain amino acid transport system permease protein
MGGDIEPGDAFKLHQSIETIVMVMLGGQGTVLGLMLGATVYQRLRGMLLVSSLLKNIQTEGRTWVGPAHTRLSSR